MQKRGFTFIEIMIAIAVFSIGVLAVLRLVTSNLIAMDKTESKTIATFLAKEGLELVYNIRDANLQKSLPRNCLLTDKTFANQFEEVDPDEACERYFSSGADGEALSVGFAESGYFFAEHMPLQSAFTENFSAFRLLQMTGMAGDTLISRYGQGNESGLGHETAFSRYILFTGVKDGSKILPLQDVLKVESHVLFVKGATTGEIVLESLIGRY